MTFEIELNGRGRTVSIERAGADRPVPRHRRRRRRRSSTRSGAAGPASRCSFPMQSHQGVACPVRARPGAGRAARLPRRPQHRRSPSTAAAPGAAPPTAGGDGARRAEASSRRCPDASSACWSPPATRSSARQPVVVVEAMKMENELRSPKAGRVKDVAVTPGTSVEAGPRARRHRITWQTIRSLHRRRRGHTAARQ